MANPNTEKNSGELEGEGNRTADREYREAATRHAQSGKSEEAAKRAKRAVEETGEDLAEAERKGKQGPQHGDAE